MRCGLGDGRLGQKKDVSGQTGESSEVWSLVNGNVLVLIS